MSPSTHHRASTPNYSVGEHVSFVSTFHFDAKGASTVPWYLSPIPRASLFAALWYHISICIRADIPNCYENVYGPLPHLQVWYSLCIFGYKSSHLSSPLLPVRLASLSPPSIPKGYQMHLVSFHPHWVDIPNCCGSVCGPLPHLLVRYSYPLSTLYRADSANYPVMSPLTPRGPILPNYPVMSPLTPRGLIALTIR